MAILGNTTLTGCNSIPDFISAGARVMFAQGAAPTSWTRVGGDTENNRMLRVVSGAGGGVGGSADPTFNNVVPAHTHAFNTGFESASHEHGFNTGNVSSGHVHTFNNLYFAENFGNGNEIGLGNGYAGSNKGADYDNRPFYLNWNTFDISANHYHGGATSGINRNHYHGGSTDNGSSQTNWSPRYINMILCSKN